MTTITLTPAFGKNVLTNFDDKLIIPNVTTYRVGYKLIWIEYNDGESIIAVKRTDYRSMVVNAQTNVVLHGDGFERINCESHRAENTPVADDEPVVADEPMVEDTPEIVY